MKYPFNRLYIAAAVSIAVCSFQLQAAPDDYRWPYNQGSKVNFNVNDIKQSYDSWKNARITANNAGSGRYRVTGGVNDGTSVSEGIAYGMLLTSLFDDQLEFDGLWLFAQDHFNDQNLMDWYIGNPGQLLGEGAATDGDVDMAIALVNACVKTQKNAWPLSETGIDYCTDARDIIENIYRYEIDHAGPLPQAGLSDNLGDELLPGDEWNLSLDYPEGVMNLSYFPPAFFRVFGEFTNQSAKWQRVIDRNYAMVDQIQAKSDNCSGLIPNWNQYDGDVQVVAWQPNNSGWWSYDAARFGWRIATDAIWYGEPDAMETVNEVGSFFASVGMNNIGGEYRMNGQSVNNGANNFFIGNAGSPIVAASQLSAVNCGHASGSIKSDAQDAYNRTWAGGITPNDYYGAYWRLVNMMLMTGNFPNLYALEGSGGSDPVVALTSPIQGQVFASGASVSVSADASDDGQITSVEFLIDSVSIGSDTSAPYSMNSNSLSDGAHSVQARATDNEGNTTQSASVSISVGSSNQAPTADIALSSQNNLSISVSGAGSSDSDGSIQNYAWNFGDGTSASGVEAMHTYASAGNYTVQLEVTDNEGESHSSNFQVTVNTGDIGGSTCDYVVINEWDTGFVVEIHITNSGAQPINQWQVSWSYNDGSTMSSGWNANYSGNNPYTATNLSWNNTIQPGQSISFGFQGSKGQASVPAPKPNVSGAVCN